MGYLRFREGWDIIEPDLHDFSRAQYENQWKKAVEIVLEERRTTALIHDVSIGEDGIGKLCLYGIVPSELAGNTEGKRARLKDFPKEIADGVYLTERFMYVTTDLGNLKQDFYLEFEGGTKWLMPLYYLDLENPERIFPYLGDNIADVWHEYCPNTELRKFLDEDVSDRKTR